MPYVDVDRAKIWYEDTGGDGPAILLTHAAAGHSGCWHQQVPAFQAAGYRVVTWDMRGFGRSETDAGATNHASIAEDLERLVAHIALPPFYLVATAYGGFGGLEFAIDNPEKLKALVLSTSFGGLTDPAFIEFRSANIPPGINQRPVQERELGASYRAANPEGMARFLEMEHNSYRGDDARQSLRRPSTPERIQTLKVPALVIAGEEDVLAPPPVMRRIADYIPGAEFQVIPGAGHSAYWEQPDVWNGLILDFARKHA